MSPSNMKATGHGRDHIVVIDQLPRKMSSQSQQKNNRLIKVRLQDGLFIFKITPAFLIPGLINRQPSGIMKAVIIFVFII